MGLTAEQEQFLQSLQAVNVYSWLDELSNCTQLERTSTVRVVNAGMVKAGKSTLFNALIEHDKTFAVGAVRTTTENQELDYDGFLLIDTPGLNVNAEDTEEAKRAYRIADVIVYVHNVVAGELTKQQIDHLRTIRDCFGADAMFRERLLFVCTNFHQLAGDDWLSVRGKVVAQVERELGFSPADVYGIDSDTHLRGVTEVKPLLREESGVTRLKADMLALVENARNNRQQLLAEKRIKICGKLSAWMVEEEHKLHDQLSSIHKEQTKHTKLKEELDSQLKSLDTKIFAYRDQMIARQKEGGKPDHKNSLSGMSGQRWVDKLNSMSSADLILDPYRGYLHYEAKEGNKFHELYKEAWELLLILQTELNKIILKVDAKYALKLNTVVQVNIENSYNYGPNPVAIGMHALGKYRGFIFDLYEAVAAEADVANSRLQECVAEMEQRLQTTKLDSKPVAVKLQALEGCRSGIANLMLADC
jgi:hypothetical protein